jgi:cytochrome c oxidase subunit II
VKSAAAPPFAASTLALTGCADTVQTMFGGQGADSRDFLSLLSLFLIVTSVMYLLVIGFLIAAILRKRGVTQPVDQAAHDAPAPHFKMALLGWIALVGVGLTVLALASFFTDRSMAQTASRSALEVEITANQWWWSVRYYGADASQTLETANELHLPVDTPVHITLKSNDVIHSFWVPNLAGKQDLIPGRTTDITLRPSRQGLYRAQCAEFCGVQHAHMALDVTVESRADFLDWYRASLQPARAPSTPLQLAGYNYVTTRQCAMCHTINGTSAGSRFGPDLTHIASRRSIAAGTLPMNRGNLYGWIADPQSQKPGSKMPTLGLEPAELHAVVNYLESLK